MKNPLKNLKNRMYASMDYYIDAIITLFVIIIIAASTIYSASIGLVNLTTTGITYVFAGLAVAFVFLGVLIEVIYHARSTASHHGR